ncbi:uncharacterized protein BX663DRAFT_520669 [Cokeromyces recurvatus]|uniref:uncharacterized protein n=1 Tax=Cokeromyces recurvatus TaxID=90255 RepID=UPI00221E42E2|nr:uncharacterized protein BX663DRAFT_520669 [Cokeromyces recurvatus]KAI7899598.1 hypothetical protein BX663DRAFT_520669 [Cokeromyces recurvatus]
MDRKYNSRRLSFSSDISDEGQDLSPMKSSKIYHQNKNYWDQLLAQFDSQSDMAQLIQLCRTEEYRRQREETKTKLKEYQVWYQLQNLQGKKLPKNDKEYNPHLPSLSHY